MTSNNKRRYMDGCFCGDWVDVDVSQQSDAQEAIVRRKRKDLQTLLEELEDIKKNFEKIAEKQAFLDNLWKFHNGDFAEQA